MKNLILGAAKGYGWNILEPFVTSCKMNCPDARLVLFVGDVSDFTRDKLIRVGVQLETFPDVKGIPNNTRWKVLADFLDAHGDEYETVFVTDTRDAIFQGDLFAAFDDCKNWLGFATEGDDIGGSLTGYRGNYMHMTLCFDKAQADKLADKKVICCGTVIGSSHEMKTFCRELWRILEHKTTDIFDQDVTNWLVYNGRLQVENIFEIDVDRGEIFTACLFGEHTSIEIRNGMILRGDGAVPQVVHQYDRRYEMILLVDELYRDKNFTFDERFTDTRSTLEQVICLLHADKTVEAVRRFLKVFFAATDWNKFVGLLINIWQLALRKDFSPVVETLELAAQNALLSVKKFSDNQLNDMHGTLVRAQKNHHAVDPEFKNALANHLLRLAEYHLKQLDEVGCFLFLKLIQTLDPLPDENFQRVVDKANRTFGRKT